jgi:hypothetical protein
MSKNPVISLIYYHYKYLDLKKVKLLENEFSDIFKYIAVL